MQALARVLDYRTPSEFGSRLELASKMPQHEAEAFYLVSLKSSDWKTIWGSLERMSNRLEELGIDSECYNREG